MRRACPEMATLVAKRHNWLPLPRAGEGWGEGFLHFRTRSSLANLELPATGLVPITPVCAWLAI